MRKRSTQSAKSVCSGRSHKACSRRRPRRQGRGEGGRPRGPPAQPRAAPPAAGDFPLPARPAGGGMTSGLAPGVAPTCSRPPPPATGAGGRPRGTPQRRGRRPGNERGEKGKASPPPGLPGRGAGVGGGGGGGGVGGFNARLRGGPQPRANRGESREVRVSGQYESRDPHADERRARHDRAAARHRTHRDAAPLRADRAPLRRGAAPHHQRHPRFLQDRSGQDGARRRRLRRARDHRGSGRTAGGPRACQGAGTAV